MESVTLQSMKKIGQIIAETTQAQLAATADTGTLERAGAEPTTPSTAFSGRDGYVNSFLTNWDIPLPMPTDEELLTNLSDGSGKVLKYHHFSVLMSKERRMPLLTAVNIDGSKSQKIGRISVWSFDGRMPKETQWGDALYDTNALDRGHMVRREDPIWGDQNDADMANRDTFHFTNSCPQMAGVNQKIWLGLENYVLQNARADGMKISVFTGPYFSDKDLEYRGALVPLAFWKVVAFQTQNGRPSATAYKVSQEKELSDLEFVYAGYKTFQISIKQVMEDTDIDFGALVNYDGFSTHDQQTGQRLEETLNSLDDIRV
jgi:endonuclease G